MTDYNRLLQTTCRWVTTFCALLFLAACNVTTAEDRPDPAKLPGYVRPTDAQAIERAKLAVMKILKDPESARFSDVTRRTAPNARGEPTDVICGNVNAKNGFGGYTGGSGFVYFVSRNDVQVIGGNDAGLADVIVSQFCKA